MRARIAIFAALGLLVLGAAATVPASQRHEYGDGLSANAGSGGLVDVEDGKVKVVVHGGHADLARRRAQDGSDVTQQRAYPRRTKRRR